MYRLVRSVSLHVLFDIIIVGYISGIHGLLKKLSVHSYLKLFLSKYDIDAFIVQLLSESKIVMTGIISSVQCHVSYDEVFSHLGGRNESAKKAWDWFRLQ